MADLPPESALRWIVSRYARLRAAHGATIGDPELLEPTGRHFPDPYSGDAPSVGRLFRRMLSYAPLAEDIPIALTFVDPAQSESAEATSRGGGGGCGSDACGGGAKVGAHEGVIELDDAGEGGYRVEVRVSDAAHPILLTTSLARSVGALVLFESGEREGVSARQFGLYSEIAGVVCGFGTLLLGGAAVYTKACGGLRVHQATQGGIEDLAVALALFIRVQNLKPAAARAHLETTQREAFDQAMRWVDSNEALIATLRDRPEGLENGVFAIEPIRGLLGRLFAKKPAPLEPATFIPKRTVRTEAEQRRLDEARALVEEVHELGS